MKRLFGNLRTPEYTIYERRIKNDESKKYPTDYSFPMHLRWFCDAGCGAERGASGPLRHQVRAGRGAVDRACYNVRNYTLKFKTAD